MKQSYQTQYADILRRLINNPLKKTSSRIGNIHGNFVELIRIDLQDEFPLMDIKKIQFSNILHELIWFINGNTNNKYLIENGCNIWTDDSYRYYNEKYAKFDKSSPLTKEEFISNTLNRLKFTYGYSRINNSDEYELDTYAYGDLDRIYGKQWREFNGKTDQLQNCINKLLTNPDDRRMIVSAHNPTDIEENNVGLPSCHNMFQFHTVPLTSYEREDIYAHKYNFNDEQRGKMNPNDTDKHVHQLMDEEGIPKYYLNLWFNIRSNDTFLGNPYNIISYALLLNIIGNIVNMIPKELVCTAIDSHLYEAHIPAAQKWLERYDKIIAECSTINTTYCRSKLNIKRKLASIDDINVDDFELINYNPQSYIKAPLLT